jgi:hypothetical protein
MNKRIALFFIKLRGRFRTLFLECPECNSTAPDVYVCEVCDGVRYLTRQMIKEEVWPKFVAKHTETSNEMSE